MTLYEGKFNTVIIKCCRLVLVGLVAHDNLQILTTETIKELPHAGFDPLELMFGLGK